MNNHKKMKTNKVKTNKINNLTNKKFNRLNKEY